MLGKQLATSVAILMLTGCAGEGPRFDSEDEERVRQVIQNLNAAFNAKDPQKAAALFSTTGVVMPPNRSLMRGRQFVEQYYTDRFAEGATDLVLEPGEVSGQGTLAYASGDFSLRFELPDEPPRRDRGKFLWVFREQTNQWMIEYVIFSSDFTAPRPDAAP